MSCDSDTPGTYLFLEESDWFQGSTVKILKMGSRNFYPIFILLFGCQVSGVSVQDRLLGLPFLTPET